MSFRGRNWRTDIVDDSAERHRRSPEYIFFESGILIVCLESTQYQVKIMQDKNKWKTTKKDCI